VNAFWLTWRKEIVRGAVLFGTVLAGGLLIHYTVRRVKAGLATSLPAVLDELKSDFAPDVGAGPRKTAETWTYRAKLAPRQWVWIRTRRGTITVEPAAGDSLEVQAVKTYRQSDPAQVRVVTAPYDGGVVICAVWDQSAAGCAPGEEVRFGVSHASDVAVDFTVRLPRGAGVGAATMVGAVRVTGASAPVVARTVSGDVDAETRAGPVNAVAMNGNIHARIRAFGDTGAVKLFTANGSVTAELPARLDATVEASTANGTIETDFPLAGAGRGPLHKLRGTLGAGGRAVRLTTVNGSITLAKLP
jgi:hypothetical protein